MTAAAPRHLAALPCALALAFASGPARAAGFTLATVGNDGSLPASHYSGDHPAISADGRYVAFRSSESNLVSPASSGYQIFLRDLQAGTTELVSRNDAGDPGNGSSDWPSVSADGCRVAFQSDASNLVAGDANGTTDVFVRQRCGTSATLLASVDSAEQPSGSQSLHPSLSGDGRVVAFWSYGLDLTAGAVNRGQIYLRDLDAGTTLLVSDNAARDGKGGNYGSDCPSVSDDGTRVAFWSIAYDLVSGDDFTVWDVFVWEAGASPAVTRVSTSAAGAPQNLGNNGVSSVTWPAISGDGRHVAWASESTNLVAGDTNGVSDVFVKDTVTGGVVRASVSSTGAQLTAASSGRPALSGDGRWAAFRTGSGDFAPEAGGVTPAIALYDGAAGATRGLAAAASSDEPALSHGATLHLAAYLGSSTLDPAHAAAGVYRWTGNRKPVAQAGPDSARNVGQLATLNGASSSDPDGDTLTYQWSQTFGPVAVTLQGLPGAVVTFTAPQEGTYIFQLVVNDGQENSDPSFVSVTVAAAPAPQKAGGGGCSSGGEAGGWALLAPLLAALRRRARGRR